MLDGNFQTDAQHRILFKPGTWLNKLDFINHLVLFNNVLITVLAERQGGKSSFVDLLGQQLDQQIKPVSFKATTPCNPNLLIQHLCNELHLNIDSKTSLASVARQINERKSHVLVIIDDAHNLPEDVIKDMLTEIKIQDELGYVHLCLISDYSIIASLNHLALDQFNNLIHTIELGALNETETRTYVLQRAMEERLINKPLTDAQFKKFYQQTKGNIAKINHSLEGYIKTINEKQHSGRAAWVMRVGVSVAASVVAGLAFMYYDPLHPTNAGNAELEFPVQAVVAQNAEPISQIASWNEAAVRELIVSNIAPTQPLEVIAKTENNRQVFADAALRMPGPPHKPDTNNHARHERASREVERHEHHSTRLALANPISAPSKPTSVEAATIKDVTNEIAKVQAGIYAIQLVASHNKSDVVRFREAHQLADKTRIHRFINNKGSWYVLTYGSFKNTTEAKQELNHLPNALQSLKPWIRDVSRLQHIG